MGGDLAIIVLRQLSPLGEDGGVMGRDAGAEVVAKEDLGRGWARGAGAVTDLQQAPVEVLDIDIPVGRRLQDEALHSVHRVLCVAVRAERGGRGYGVTDAPTSHATSEGGAGEEGLTARPQVYGGTHGPEGLA